MKSPFETGIEWSEVEEVDSTQKLALSMLKAGTPVSGVIAANQTAGTGRFGRPWISKRGDSLTMTLVFGCYANHPKPYLVGMGVAAAAAGALHCQLRWPNDLVIGERKLGGILTEVVLDPEGRSIPLVGIGINLNQKQFPEEIAHRATSLSLFDGIEYDYQQVALRIVDHLQHIPEPDSWLALQPAWMLFDKTPGKKYKLHTDEEAVALGIGSEGQLLCAINGESRSVLAADAIFGPSH